MKLLNVSISPHIRSRETTASIMLDVIIALLPCLVIGVAVFGLRVLMITLLCVVSCVATECLYEKALKLPVTIGDLSAVVTGMILAVNLYSTAPWWLPVIGGVFAILVVKMLFGGIGQNFMNPALAARCFLLLSFTRIMTNYPIIDATTTATPLALANAGETVDVLTMLTGYHSGAIGETSAIAILIGGMYLFLRRVIRPHGPLSVIASTTLFVTLFSLINGRTITVNYILANIFGGGLLIGAVFMASDYATTPVTFRGQIVFGVCVGLLTAFMRCFCGATEGVSYAIILSNLLTPVIEKLTYPRPFGIRSEEGVRRRNRIIRNTAALALITLVAGLALSSVFEATEETISDSVSAERIASYREVMPLAERFEAIAPDVFENYTPSVPGTEVSECFRAVDPDGDPVGYVLSVTSRNGYGGDITLSAGIADVCRLTGVRVTEMSETSGLGAHCKDPEWIEQFTGITAEAVQFTKTGKTAPNEIDAISGATVTTTAVTDAVNEGLAFARTLPWEGIEK